MLGRLDGWDDGGFESLGEGGDGREVGVGRGGEVVRLFACSALFTRGGEAVGSRS